MTYETDADSWWKLAACQSADPEMFFPVSNSGTGNAEIAQAIAVCGSCAIRHRCLEYALESGQVHGVWGGTTEEERRSLIYKRRHLVGSSS